MVNFSNDVWMASTASGFYPHSIGQSLRGNEADSPYLSRTPSSASNRKTYTISAWIKPSLEVATFSILGAGSSGSAYYIFGIEGDDLYFEETSSGGALRANRKLRDPSAWYHLVASVDTTQATASNRIKLYVNGVRETSFSGETYMAQDFESAYINNTSVHYIGYSPAQGSHYLNGYMSEVVFLDGVASDPTTLGLGELKDGIWVPKNVSGLTFGTNGFHLDFADSSAIGNDVSGQNNDFAVSGLAATDVLPTSPTNTFAVLQPTAFVNIGGANSAQTLSEGNLKFTGTSSEGRSTPATIRVTSGKYYVEATKVSGSGSVVMDFVVNDASVADKSTSTTGDIIIGAVDVDAGKYWSGLNNTWDGSGNPATGANPTGTFTANSSFTFSGRVYDSSRAGVFNFGQDSSFAGNKTSGSAGASDTNGIGDFYYTPPTDYLTLCSANLPEPAIIDGSEYFNTALYTGNGSNGLAITGVNFQPNWTWIKSRSGTAYHELHDSIRGAGKRLFSNETTAEGDVGTVSSFDSDGFTVSRNSAYDGTNQNAKTFVSWNWLAGTAVSGNTSGSGTAKAYSGSVNTEAGFSIITYKGNGTAGHTIPHHLGKTPTFIIVKDRDNASNWRVWGTGVSIAKALGLDTSNAEENSGNDNGNWNNTLPTDNVFSVGSFNSGNRTDADFIAYCFTDIEGYSKAGSYIGNGNADGTFIHTGFRPSWVMIKRTDSSADWWVLDNKRNSSNVVDLRLRPNSSSAEEGPDATFDFLANGLKIRGNYSTLNASSGTYIYLAFAEQPFKYANAR